MTDLLIGTLHATATVADPDDEVRVRRLLADLTGRRLEEAFAGAAVPEGEWCVRRVDVPLSLDGRATDPDLARRWAARITAAIGDLVAGGAVIAGSDVVHYPRRADARVDLVASLAQGDAAREWAWRALGTLAADDPDPASESSAAALAVLTRDPAAAVHVLAAAASPAGLPALHRLLGAAGWRAVAAAALAAAGLPPAWLDGATSGADRFSLHRNESRGAEDHATVPASVAGRSLLARAWRASRLRPSAAVERVWALLVVLEAEPTLLRRPAAQTVLALLPAVVRGDPVPVAPGAAPVDLPFAAATGDPSLAPSVGGSVAAPVLAAPDAAGVPEASAPVVGAAAAGELPALSASGPTVAPSPAVAQPSSSSPVVWPTGASPVPADAVDTVVASPTSCGGLVHLLATATAACVPDALLEDSELDGEALSWSLFQLYRRLAPAEAAPGDAALLALAGLPLGVPPEPAPTGRQARSLDRHAARWAAVTAARLETDPVAEPQSVVAALVAREGWVEASGGWVEVRLRLVDVDLAVRRTGLDVDPGYVPWLGRVVVIRYE